MFYNLTKEWYSPMEIWSIQQDFTQYPLKRSPEVLKLDLPGVKLRIIMNQ